MIQHSKPLPTQAVVIALILIIIIGVFWVIPAIPQDPNYHQFADRRLFLGIPNFTNVISNLTFLLVGSIGIWSIKHRSKSSIPDTLKPSCYLFFSGVLMVGLSSPYYHLNPQNSTLFWDRAPMTITFMAFFNLVIGAYISEKWSKTLLFPLLSIGLFSVIYWSYTETTGNGDLRLYILVQFFPLLLIPLILLTHTSKTMKSRSIWFMLGFYALAKLFEWLDAECFIWTGWISGHSIKHFFAALGPLFILSAFDKN